MARIIFPESFLAQKTLIESIRDKHVADAANSVIKPFTIQHGIDMVADATTAGAALIQENNRLLFKKQSENYTQLRNNGWESIMSAYRNGNQLLKKFYAPNVAELGNWGSTISTNGKITYPADFAALVLAFKNFAAKHNSFAAGSSPLQLFLTQNNLVMPTLVAAADAVLLNDSKSAQAAINSETATQNRNLLMADPIKHYTAIGGYLIKLFPANTKKLGDWGFVVDDSPQKQKEQTSTLKLSDSIVLKGVTIGGTLKNMSDSELHVYKGSGTSGTPIVVLPGEMLGITKGFSTITVVNTSTLSSAKFKVLRHV